MKAGVKLSEALDLTREWLSGIDSTEDDMEINPTVLAELEERSKAMRRELEGKVAFSFTSLSRSPLGWDGGIALQRLTIIFVALEQDIKDRESRINSQFTDMHKHGYRIHSVFIHRGEFTNSALKKDRRNHES